MMDNGLEFLLKKLIRFWEMKVESLCCHFSKLSSQLTRSTFMSSRLFNMHVYIIFQSQTLFSIRQVLLTCFSSSNLDISTTSFLPLLWDFFFSSYLLAEKPNKQEIMNLLLLLLFWGEENWKEELTTLFIYNFKLKLTPPSHNKKIIIIKMSWRFFR